MKRADVLGVVRRVIRQDLECEVLVEEPASILGDLQLDSLQRLTLAVELENHFEICFDLEDEQGLSTIGDLVDLIERQLGEGRCDADEA
jgi:acyl carrier protein